MQKPHFLRENVDISLLSAFKTRATARYLYDIMTTDDAMLLPEIFWFARESWLPVTIVGGGTNCLFAFYEYAGIFIHNRLSGYSEPYDQSGKKYIRVQSGELSTTFATKLYQNYSISTLIPWVGLPGTMGGACIGNAGCFGLEMKDLLVEANVLDLETWETCRFTLEDMRYGYRESILKENPRYFVVDMLLSISPKGGEYETYTPTNLQSLRKLKQPPGLSCGSFFRNPRLEEYHAFIGGHEDLVGERGHIETLSAGKLIDEAGLKGTRVGGVHVSERHGNFFLNDQKGTWQDILALRDLVKAWVEKKHGIVLHEEVRIITNSDRDK